MSRGNFQFRCPTTNNNHNNLNNNHRNISIHKSGNTPSKRIVLILSLALNSILLTVVISFFFFSSTTQPTESLSFLLSDTNRFVSSQPHHNPIQFHGGNPLAMQSGTCYCSSNTDNYCLCTPSLAIDLILLSGTTHVWLVQRNNKDTQQQQSNPSLLACMGGFVEMGETVEEAVYRELNEEMQIEKHYPMQLVGVYSDPRRDKRRHTVSVVYVMEIPDTENFEPVAADDAKGVVRIPIAEIATANFFADHKSILLDYMRKRFEGLYQPSTSLMDATGDFTPTIQRSLCTK